MSVRYHEAKKAYYEFMCSVCDTTHEVITHSDIDVPSVPLGWAELISSSGKSHLCADCIERFAGYWDVAGRAVVMARAKDEEPLVVGRG